LDYERPVFEWLEATVAGCDTIIEIGANVGVYSVFFGTYQTQTSDGPRPRIFAFEPGPTAFRRLTENLRENNVAVHAIQCAVAEHPGVVELHEPAGHLTNSSLRPDFAGLFSGDVAVHAVQAVDGRAIAAMVGNPGRTLLKIDVEGAEAAVLRGLRAFIEAHRPDILIELLALFAPELQTIDFLDPLGYRYHAVRAGGLVESRGFDSAIGSRDMILRSERSAAQ
jgi:FkbM family methyltransferase